MHKNWECASYYKLKKNRETNYEKVLPYAKWQQYVKETLTEVIGDHSKIILGDDFETRISQMLTSVQNWTGHHILRKKLYVNAFNVLECHNKYK